MLGNPDALIFSSLCLFVKRAKEAAIYGHHESGAGPAYLNGGSWQVGVVFTTIRYMGAYKGLQSTGHWRWLDITTGWTSATHRLGKSIVRSLPTSSLGCALCDPVSPHGGCRRPFVYRLSA